MEFRVDPGLVTVFGSETRVRTLAALASTNRPLTAYRVGKMGEVSMPKVYREVARLAKAGLVTRRGSGWILLDSDIRNLLRRRVRFSWSEDWFADEADRARRAARIAAEPSSWFDSSRYARNPSVAERYAKEFERPAEKGPSRKSL